MCFTLSKSGRNRRTLYRGPGRQCWDPVSQALRFRPSCWKPTGVLRRSPPVGLWEAFCISVRDLVKQVMPTSPASFALPYSPMSGLRRISWGPPRCASILFGLKLFQQLCWISSGTHRSADSRHDFGRPWWWTCNENTGVCEIISEALQGEMKEGPVVPWGHLSANGNERKWMC